MQIIESSDQVWRITQNIPRRTVKPMALIEHAASSKQVSHSVELARACRSRICNTSYAPGGHYGVDK